MSVRAWNVRRGWVLLLAMGLCTGGAVRTADAVTTATWRVAGREAFSAAGQESLAVDSEGGVRLAPAFDAIRGVDESYVWSLLAVPGQGVRIGTGTRATLLTLAGGADVARAVGRAVAVQINCMTVAPDGALFLGTGPDGTIFKLAPNDSTPKVFCDLPERHVWNLVRESSGSLLAATGDRARLYRIDAQGNAKQLYAGSPDHFTSMARWQGKTLVGGDSDGVVYAVDDAGRANVLMDAAEQEVKVLAVAPDGRLYAAVNPPPGEGLGAPAEADDAGRRKGPKPTLYRILANGVVETVWTSPDQTIQAMLFAPDGHLLVGTGAATAGGLFRVNVEDGGWELLGRPGPPQVLALALDGETLYLGTGGPGKLYRAALRGSPLGTMTSTVFDARQLSDWGVLRFDRGESTAGTLEFQTRSGLSGKPDDSWSDWSGALSAPDGAPITSPPGRFLQWRATLKRGSGDGPRLFEVVVAYRQRNQTPVVRSINLTGLGTPLQRGGDDGGPQPVVQNLPGNLRVEYSLGSSRDRNASDEEAAWARRFRTIRWDASDPNDDNLVYRLEVRGRGESAWQLIKDELRDPVYAWDSGQVPDGRYVLRVTASDRLENPADETRTASRESAILTVDNTPPLVEGLVARLEGGRLKGTARVRDALGPLRALDVAVDGGEWMPVIPVDRVLDQAAESVAFDVPARGDGDHLVALRAVDAAGNVGVGRVAVPAGPEGRK